MLLLAWCVNIGRVMPQTMISVRICSFSVGMGTSRIVMVMVVNIVRKLIYEAWWRMGGEVILITLVARYVMALFVFELLSLGVGWNHVFRRGRNKRFYGMAT